jgi:hypothetical protein
MTWYPGMKMPPCEGPKWHILKLGPILFLKWCKMRSFKLPDFYVDFFSVLNLMVMVGHAGRLITLRIFKWEFRFQTKKRKEWWNERKKSALF